MRLLVVLLALLPSFAAAQAYPSKPVRLILSFVPGIGTDVFARLVAPKLSESLAQPVLVENRAGASGAIGAEAVFKAAPDGYTLLFSSSAQTIALAHTVKNLPYDPNGFTPIMAAIEPLIVLVVRPALPGTFRELIDHAKRNPGKVTYGSTGTGSTFHLFGESLNSAAGISLLHVPYKGTLPAVNDMMGGNLDMSFGSLAGIGQLMSAGKIRAVAVLGTKRSGVLPDVPAVTEVVPTVDIAPGWFAFWGPPQMPQPIARRLHADLLKAMNAPDMRAWYDANGFIYMGTTPEELLAMQKAGHEVFSRVVRTIGLKPQ
jgi:tripartite-type tricarboxylate transporter receptor subunit TctC